ncbi:MAG: hypothetical protein CMP68_05540 [Flavobacteriales bacterium]|nr:hypothetical protein [Flavobacteriales bacterium]
MQTSNKYLLILFSVLLFNFSCEISTNSNATGKSLEVILVQGNELSNASFNLFKKNLFSIQKPLLETELYGEKKNYLSLISISENDFSTIFKTHKNIVIINSGETNKVKLKRDLWSKNQTVYFCSIEQLDAKNIETTALKVAEKIKNSEVDKRTRNFFETTPQEIKIYAEKNFNLYIPLPSSYFITDTVNSHLVLRSDSKNSTQRIVISSFNLKPTVQNIILEQNKIAKFNIKSEIEGAYLRIEDRAHLYVDSLSSTLIDKKNLKGIWKMEGDFMGGSFFTSLINNPYNENHVLVSLYLYAPGINKASQLLDFEAITNGFSLINN